jgi:hypothetical protein
MDILDELVNYECPHCGNSNETCICEEYNDGYYDDMDDCDEPEYPEEILCYLNGKPIYKGDVESYFMNEDYNDGEN